MSESSPIENLEDFQDQKLGIKSGSKEKLSLECQAKADTECVRGFMKLMELWIPESRKVGDSASIDVCSPGEPEMYGRQFQWRVG